MYFVGGFGWAFIWPIQAAFVIEESLGVVGTPSRPLKALLGVI